MSKFIYNSINKQNKKYPNELTVQEWNNIINALSMQSNNNTEHSELLHRWLVGDGEELPGLEGKSLFEYINTIASTITPEEGEGSGGGVIKPIEDVLDDDRVNALYNELADGIYAIISEQYGHEFVIINKPLEFFKRITGYHDYVYNFDLEEWVAVSGAGSSAGTVFLELISSPTRTLAVGSECKITFSFKSTQTKTGIARYYINEILKMTAPISQGENTVDITNYIIGGTNSIRISITDSASNTGVIDGILYTGVSLTMKSYLNTDKVYFNDEAFVVQYNVIGAGTKDIYMYLDDDTTPIYVRKDSTTSNTAINETLNMTGRTHGVHTISIYAETTVEDTYIQSNIVTHKFMYVHRGNTTPIILSNFTPKESYKQGDAVIIDYMAYTQGRDTTSVIYTLNGTVVSTPSVRFEPSSWDLTSALITLTIPTDDEGNYTYLDVTVSISADTTKVEFTFDLTKSEYNLNPVEGYVLNLSSAGRSNDEPESTRSVWTDGTTTAVMTGFNWGTNGWCHEDPDDVNTPVVLRVTHNAKVEIPFQPFASNVLARGKTIEIDFKARDVYDLTKELITCYTTSGTRKIGFSITSNDCLLQSVLTTLTAKYKDEERIKLTFCIHTPEPVPLMYIYLNGIFSGFIKYTDTEFLQSSPTNIIINPNQGSIDIYSIRIYDVPLSAPDIVHNYIIDLDSTTRATTIVRNDILDDNKENIVISKAQPLIPTLSYVGTLPTTKGTGQSTDESVGWLTFTNVSDPRYNFIFPVLIKIQGTSSVAYPIKNYQVTILATDSTGQPYKEDGKWVKHPEGIIFYEGGIPEVKFTFKADYMESSHSHNTGNAIIMNQYSPDFPTKVVDSRIRNSIYGYPVLFFVQEDESLSPVCYGVYNFNNDKGNYDTLGLLTGEYEGNTYASESWEFKNNGSARCKFKSGDFTSNVDNDFEARYPDGYTDYTNLQRVVAWVASTDTTAATSETLTESVTYNNIVYDTDTAEYRLAKFKAEFENYFNKEFCLFYTIMMDVLLAVDSRAKNMFLDTPDGVIWYPRWYDIDTAYGLDNEGHLKFSYGYEQTDTLDDSDSYVYNGHDSVLWNNFNEVFADEISYTYNEMRINGLSYDSILEVLNNHQIDKISETMYNIDGAFKYESLLSFVDINDKPADSYMYAAQGDRLDHLKWWLYDRFNFLDSKHKYGDYTQTTAAHLRLYSLDASYTKFNITLYTDAYVYAQYGANSTVLSKAKAKAGKVATLTPSADLNLEEINDLETYIYGTNNIVSFGDLTNLRIGLLDMKNAPRIRTLTINNGNITNETFTELTLGNITSLETLTVKKCPNLTHSIDLSKCDNIKKVYFDGTSISGVTFNEKGGVLDTLYLPNTVTSLVLHNQPELTTLSVAGYTNLVTVIIDSCPNISKVQSMLSSIATNAKNISTFEVRNIDWNLKTSDSDIMNKLYNTPCILTGKVTIRGTFNSSTISLWKEKWGEDLEINVDGDILNTRLVTYYDADNTTILKQYAVELGSSTTFNSTPPTKDGYAYQGWALTPNASVAKYGEEDSIPVPEVDAEDIQLYPVFLEYDWTELTIKPYNETQMYVRCSNANGIYMYVDWGDDSNISKTTSSSIAHTYDDSYLGQELKVKIYVTPPIDGIRDYSLTFTSSSSNSGTNYTDIISLDKLQSNVFTNVPLFYGCTGLTSVALEEGITTIGDLAFYNCSSLASITIPNSVTTIGDYAFRFCTSLTSVTIPDSVTTIGENAFYNCSNLTSVIVGNSVTNIERLAFYSCSGLTSITIPDSVTTIGRGAFYNCSNLTSITLPFVGDTLNEASYTKFGYIFSTNSDSSSSVPSSLKTVIITNATSIGEDAFSSCTNLTSITIPNSVTTIGDHAFYRCSSLTNTTIPESVTSIGDYAFSGCDNLTKITIPESVTSIGDYAFQNCDNLTSITIPNSVTSIGSSVFYDCDSLASITIPDSVTTIGTSAFSSCDNLTSITIPDSVTTIGGDAFSFCKKLTSITIPDSVTTIGSSAFSWCDSLTTVYFKGTADQWVNIKFGSSNANPTCYASTIYFYEDGKYVLPTSLTITVDTVDNGIYTLAGPTNIKHLIFAEGCTTFTTNYGYETLTLPSTLTRMKVIASSCKTLYYDGTIEQYLGMTFTSSVSESSNIYTNLESMYINKVLVKDLIIPEGVITIPDYAFYYCNVIESVHFPSTLLYINQYAFYHSSITFSELPPNLLSIGQYAFGYCDNIPYLIFIPFSTITLEYRAFYSTDIARDFYVPSTCINIASYAIPYVSNKVTYIYTNNTSKPDTWDIHGDSSFFRTHYNTPMNYSQGVYYYKGPGEYSSGGLRYDYVARTTVYAEQSTNILSSITLGDNVYNITKLIGTLQNTTQITIPTSITRISLVSESLTDVYYEGTLDQWFNITQSTSHVLLHATSLYIKKDDAYYDYMRYPITIPDTITTLKSYSIVGNMICDTLPSTLDYVYDNAFYKNREDTTHSVRIETGIYKIYSTAFVECGDNFTIYCVDASKPSNWYSDWNNNYPVVWDCDGAVTVGDYIYILDDSGNAGVAGFSTSFSGTKTTFDVPETITYGDITYNVNAIYYEAFVGSTVFSQVVIPDYITSIENRAFAESSITSFEIEGQLENLGQGICQDCTSLESTYIGDNNIPDNLIPMNMYNGCTSLTSIIIGDSITTIGESAFNGCDNLPKIIIPSHTTSIGDYALNIGYKCTDIKITILLGDNIAPPVITGTTLPDISDKLSIIFETDLTGDDAETLETTIKAATYWSDYADYITVTSTN